MKHIYFTILTCLLVLGVTSCSEDNFSSRYPDPSLAEKATVENLMVGMFNTGNKYTMPWYDRYFTFETQQMGRWSQTLGWLNKSGMYTGMGEGYNENRWINFYKMLAQFRTLENIYNTQLDKTKQEDYEIFLLASKVYLYDHLQQVVDLWGDVPFSKAGYIPLTIDISGSKAPYESAEDLYKFMLADLKVINTKLASAKITSLVGSLIKSQDFINNGDRTLWQKYCNSLRLRIAARISDNGSLIAEGRAVVKEILENPTLYPLVDNNKENILIDFKAPDLQAIENQDPDGIKEGFESWNGQCNRASKIMIETLTKDTIDCRLEIMFDKNAEGLYVGMDPLMSETDQQKLFDRDAKKGGNYFSAVDSATFSRNNKFPGIIMTASEIDFIKAEAYTKWGITGNAENAFRDGISKSIEFYYYLNNLGEYRTPIKSPAEDPKFLTRFLDKKWNGDSNKVRLIATQKWLHLSNILMVQAWNEVRKTGYPELQFMKDNGSLAVPNPPVRILYPADERKFNTDNYKKVQDKDTRYTKLFWAK